MIRIIFLITAALFLGGGFYSLFAVSPEVSSSLEPKSPAAVIGAADFPVVAQTLTRNEHLNILVRMGFFYAGFICILLAFDLGDRKAGENSEQTSSPPI